MISIHAPPRGATCITGSASAWAQFQFTPLREGRHRLAGCVEDRAFYFNSRPSARGDLRGFAKLIAAGQFQFTPLREGRPLRRNSPAPISNFNSRPSARGDGIAESEPRRLAISIHAPPRGATGLGDLIVEKVDISIHAPPRGATGRGESRGRRPRISIHAPPRGATSASRPSLWHHEFQFTPLREGRPL